MRKRQGNFRSMETQCMCRNDFEVASGQTLLGVGLALYSLLDTLYSPPRVTLTNLVPSAQS